MKIISLFGTMPFYLLLCMLFFIIGKKILSYELITALISSHILIAFIRMLYYKERPNKKNYKNFIEKIDSSSFPSLHSARAAIILILIGNIYRNILFLFLLLILTLLVCYSRFYLKKHYPLDILCGAMLGILLSLLSIAIFAN